MRRTTIVWGMLCLFLVGTAEAGVVFKFTEESGTVKMTSLGSLDTTKLVSVSRSDGWGGTGTEHNSAAGDIDIMGGTSFGQIDTQFGFSAGTDDSAIKNPGGPFAFSNFSVASITGSKSFTTYSGFISGIRIAGIGIKAVDINAMGIWTPDQVWTYGPGATFASKGLVVGTYTVADAITGEFITIQIGESSAVPEPASIACWSVCALGLAIGRRIRRK